MPALTVAVLAGLALAAAPAPAEVPSEPSGAPPRAVYQIHPRADALVMGTAALAIAIPSLLASDIIRQSCPCDPSTVNGFDRGAIGNHSDLADVLSSVTVGAAVVAPPLLDLADVGLGDAFYADLTVFAETLLVNGALVQGAKYVFQRPLPRTYAGDPSLVSSPRGYRSFYSGHSSTAFAALTATAYTIRLRHGEHVWPWLVAAGLGASVGVERVVAGLHFPSDVIVGAAVGTAVGIGVPWLHAAKPGVALLPSPGGVALAARF